MRIERRICDICNKEVEDYAAINVHTEGGASASLDVCLDEECLNAVPSKVKELAEKRKAEKEEVKQRLEEIAKALPQ